MQELFVVSLLSYHSLCLLFVVNVGNWASNENLQKKLLTGICLKTKIIAAVKKKVVCTFCTHKASFSRF